MKKRKRDVRCGRSGCCEEKNGNQNVQKEWKKKKRRKDAEVVRHARAK
jgi:hypothetical protein